MKKCHSANVIKLFSSF